MKNLKEINRNTWRPGASDETSVNSPFSTSPFVTSFPPPIAPFPFWEVVLEKVATTTDEEASLTGSGLSSSKLLKTLQSTMSLVRMHLRVWMIWSSHDRSSYSLRNRRCLAIAHKAARAALPMQRKTSVMHGGEESMSSKGLAYKSWLSNH